MAREQGATAPVAFTPPSNVAEEKTKLAREYIWLLMKYIQEGNTGAADLEQGDAVPTVHEIEPMIVLGSPELHLWDDGWTAVTNDASRCAQFEHTMVVTDDGVEILTVTADGRSAADQVRAQLS